MPRIVITVAVLAGLIGPTVAYPPPPKDTKPDADKLARELGVSFAASLTKRDFDAILKNVEFPYRTSSGKDTKAAATVKDELDTVLAAYWTDKGTTVAVKEVVAPDKFETWVDGLPVKPSAARTEPDRKAILDHIGTEGRIVALQFTVNGKKDDELCLLLVRVKDGKGALVGIVD